MKALDKRLISPKKVFLLYILGYRICTSICLFYRNYYSYFLNGHDFNLLFQ